MCQHGQHAGDRRIGISTSLECKMQAARAASSAAAAAQQQMTQQEDREVLPAFGSGIEFRPTKKAKQQGSSQGPQKSMALSNLAPDDDIADDGGGNDVAMQPVSKPAMVSYECMWCKFRCYADLWSFCATTTCTLSPVQGLSDGVTYIVWSNYVKFEQLSALSIFLNEIGLAMQCCHAVQLLHQVIVMNAALLGHTRMLRTDCFGETRLVLHVPSSS